MLMRQRWRWPRALRRRPLRLFPPPSAELQNAQRSAVVRARALLSRTEVAQLESALAQEDLPQYFNSSADLSGGLPVHTTCYLHSRGLFAERFPGLRDRVIALARRVNAAEGWGFRGSSLRVRCVEVHDYAPGGGLRDRRHYDIGSCVSMSIMLREPLLGGAFQSVSLDGHRITSHACRTGDALVFASHKYHRVLPVLRGARRVMVVELWTGEERHCGHRCDVRSGSCGFVDGEESLETEGYR